MSLSVGFLLSRSGVRARMGVVVVGLAVAFAVWAPRASAIEFHQSTVPFTGLSTSNQLFGVAVDPQGDVFLSANDGSSSSVLEYFAGGGQRTLPFPASGSTELQTPEGLALDAAGDLFVANWAANNVLELPAGSSTPKVVLSGLDGPADVALDPKGDLFVANNDDSEIIELAAGSTTAKTIAFPGLEAPNGIAVDTTGDLFATNDGDNTVMELPKGSSTSKTLPFTGLSDPIGVAVDSNGDVFVSDIVNNRVLELPAGGGEQEPLPFSGLDEPTWLALDPYGDVFVPNLGGGSVSELEPYVPSGSMAVAPGTVAAGSPVSISSITPCPTGGEFGSTTAHVILSSPSNATVTTLNPSLDGAGDWHTSATIPSTDAAGTYYLTAQCWDPSHLITQEYAIATLQVTSSGTTTITGAPSTTPATSPASTGPASAGQVGTPTAPLVSAPGLACKPAGKFASCTLTYTYRHAVSGTKRIRATIAADSRAGVVGHGTLRGHTLRLTLAHLRRGRYRLTLSVIDAHGTRMIGHVTITIS
jgi:hypothetical protein